MCVCSKEKEEKERNQYKKQIAYKEKKKSQSFVPIHPLHLSSSFPFCLSRIVPHGTKFTYVLSNHNT